MPLIPPNRVIAFPLKDDLQWYDPDVVFQPFDDIFGRGVAGPTDLQVVANGAGDGQISVNPGHGWVPYTTAGNKRFFKTTVPIRSDSVAEFMNAIPAWAGGNPRVHRVIARIRDATITPADSYKGGFFDVLSGAATSGATLANLSGAQAVPADALLLGNVLQNGSTIPPGNIDSTFGTVRSRARIGAGASPTKQFQVNGAALTDRGALNLIAGSNISISAADNSGADSADVTFAATVPPQNIVKLYDIVAGAGKTNFDTYVDLGNVLLPTTYTSLLVRGRVQSTASQGDTYLDMQINNDTTANYDNALGYFGSSIAGWGSQDTSQGANQIFIMRFNAATNSSGWGAFQVTFFDYASLTGRHEFYYDGVDSGSGTRRWVGSGVWHGAGSAITRLNFYPGAGAFVAGSHIQIFGII